MNGKTAKKIVNRVVAGRVTAQSYNITTVKRAFEMLEVNLTDKMLEPWSTEDRRKAEAAEKRMAADQAARKADKASRMAARHAEQEIMRKRTLALKKRLEAKALKKRPSTQNKDQGKAQIQAAEDERVFTAIHSKAVITDSPITRATLADAFAVFERHDFTSWMRSQAIPPLEAVASPRKQEQILLSERSAFYAERTLKELKARAKEAGLRRYSTMKRAELTALLIENDLAKDAR